MVNTDKEKSARIKVVLGKVKLNIANAKAL